MNFLDHRSARSRAAVAGRRGGGGFTLIEVLLATVLLAAGLALAFATLRAATATTQRGERIAQRSERMRAVEGFLRRRIAATRPIGFDLDPDSGLPLRFSGDAGRMRFVADLPDYLGRGGPYMHEFRVEPEQDGVRITVALTMVLGGQLVQEPQPRAPEVLVEGLQAARFRYRAMDADGLSGGNALGEWRERWDATDRLPLQVEVTLRDGEGRDWPPLVVALPLGGSFAPAIGERQ